MAQNLSLADLASRTRTLSKSRISNYEQGIRRMGIEEALELSVALGTVSAIYLLCLDDDGPFSAPERQLIEHYRTADERGRDTILRIAEDQAVYRPAAPKTDDKPDQQNDSQSRQAEPKEPRDPDKKEPPEDGEPTGDSTDDT